MRPARTAQSDPQVLLVPTALWVRQARRAPMARLVRLVLPDPLAPTRQWPGRRVPMVLLVLPVPLAPTRLSLVLLAPLGLMVLSARRVRRGLPDRPDPQVFPARP